MSSDNRRYIIVSTGRTGSSLLASILADAGANFGMPSRESWNPESGAYEHPLFWSAYKWYSRAKKIDASIIPNAFGWQYSQRKMQGELDQLMKQADFAKYPTGAIWLVHAIQKLGYDVRVIVNYRAFDEYARSRYLRFGWGINRITETYLDVYGTALMQLEYFGGCTVDFAEIVDRKETAWLDAIANLTGLPQEYLLHARDSRVNEKPRHSKSTHLANPLLHDPRPQEIYDALHALKGQVMKSSARN